MCRRTLGDSWHPIEMPSSLAVAAFVHTNSCEVKLVPLPDGQRIHRRKVAVEKRSARQLITIVGRANTAAGTPHVTRKRGTDGQ